MSEQVDPADVSDSWRRHPRRRRRRRSTISTISFPHAAGVESHSISVPDPVIMLHRPRRPSRWVHRRRLDLALHGSEDRRDLASDRRGPDR